MALNVGSLWANLSLNISQFMSGLSQAQAAVTATGNRMQSALGTGPTNAINNTQQQLNRLSNQMNRTGKDFERVVGGILMAQAFYRITNAIEETTKAVINFSNSMQNAQISLKYFLGSQERAQGFLEVMKDFAAVTPFSTDQAVQSSRKLMAMGFAAESVKSVMQILVDSASATGGSAEQMDRIVLALGQMKTNGRIAGQELRQLAEAGVPIYKILQEELGLTADQLKDIGELKIDGDLGVAATLKGLEKRYKGASKEISETMTGMWSTIKDDFLIASEQIFKAPYKAVEGFVRKVRDSFESIRRTVRTSGVGGLFESIFPPELQSSIRNIIASFQILGRCISDLAKAFGPSIVTAIGAFINVAGKILPVIATIISILSSWVVTIMNVVPGVKLLVSALAAIMIAQIVGKALMFFWTVVRMGTICSFVAQSVMVLGRAIQALFLVCTRNPIVGIVMLIAGALLTLALSSKTVSTWLDSVSAKLANLGGVDPGGILNPDNNKELTKWTDEFNASLGDMDKNLKNVGKNAEKAGKKTKDKFVASFDELFQIPEKLDDTSDALSDVGGASFGNMPDFKLPDLAGSIPDFSNIGNPFGDKFPLMGPENKNPKEPKGGSGGSGNIPPPDASPVTKFVETIESLIARAKKALQGLWPDPFPVPVFNLNPLETMINALERLKEMTKNVEGVFANIVLKPFVIPGIDVAIQSLNAFSEIGIKIVPILLQSFKTAFLTVGSNLLSVIGEFCKGIGIAIVDGLKSLGGWIAENWKAILLGALVAVIAVVLFIFGGEIVAAIGAIGVAIGAALAEIGAAIATFFSGGLVASATGAIGTGFAAITGAIMVAIGALTPLIINYWNEIVNFFNTIWDTLKTGTQNTWTTMKNTISTVLNTIDSLSNTVIIAVRNLITTAWSAIKTSTSTVWNIVKTVITGVLNTIDTLTKTTIDTIKGVISTAWALLQGDTTTAWTDIKMTINNMLWSMGHLVGVTMDTIKTAINLAWTGIQTLTDTVWTGIQTTVSGIVVGLGNTFAELKTNVLSIWDGIYSGIRGTINSIIGGINTLINAMNGLSFELPDWLPGDLGGKQLGFNIPNVPYLATGGIVNKDQLVRVGEGNKREAVIPLENSNYMKPFSAAVASDIMTMLGGNRQSYNAQSTGAETPSGQVIFIAADERSLKELERKLNVIRISEKQRRL